GVWRRWLAADYRLSTRYGWTSAGQNPGRRQQDQLSLRRIGPSGQRRRWQRPAAGIRLRRARPLDQRASRLGHLLRYRYDVCGQLSQLRLPDNSKLDYHYAKGGALTAIDLNGTRLTTHTFALGREQQRQQGQ